LAERTDIGPKVVISLDEVCYVRPEEEAVDGLRLLPSMHPKGLRRLHQLHGQVQVRWAR